VQNVQTGDEVNVADVIELARQYDEAFNTKDADARMSMESPDIEVIMPGGMILRGPEQVMQVVRAFWEALPDGRIVPENQVAAGDGRGRRNTKRHALRDFP
jgi:ketosteroid isomerase-like protein